LSRSEPGLTDEECYEHFVATFGAPETVAQCYEDAAQPSRINRIGIAPNWRICCTRCGRSAPAENAGITRIGARSKHKYVLGWCRDCRRFRWLRLQRDLNRTNLSDALGMNLTGAEFRNSSHKPWRVIFLILLLALLLGVLLPLLLRR
ncbi:MAG: hypothetical protein ACR2NZ_06440, partial [Rubripirellula sp.]